MKQPVHSIQRKDDRIFVRRLKKPFFFGFYNPEKDAIVDVEFTQLRPNNTEALFKKAAAAAKLFLHNETRQQAGIA